MDAVAKGLAAIGIAAIVVLVIAISLSILVFGIYIGLAGATAIVASGTLLFGAPVTWSGVGLYVAFLFVAALFSAGAESRR